MPKNPIDNDAYLSADDYLHGVFWFELLSTPMVKALCNTMGCN